MKRTSCPLLLLLVCGLVMAVTQSEAQVPAKDSSRRQLQQLTEQLAQIESPDQWHEKIVEIFNLARTMSPPPALPEEAERRMARGIAAFKDAKSVSDYYDAVTEFQKATWAAPWYADAYYNLGRAKAKAEDYAGAARSLKLYLLAAPEAKDAAAAKTLMYEMEYKQEKTDKERSSAEAKAQQLAREQQQVARERQAVQRFRGAWYGAQCYVGNASVNSLSRGCTYKEHEGRNWHPSPMGPVQFEIQNDGAIKIMSDFNAWAGCEGDVFGVYGPNMLGDLTWKVRSKNGTLREISATMYPNDALSEVQNLDATQLTISCNRPLFGQADDVTGGGVPYKYVMWSRTPFK